MKKLISIILLIIFGAPNFVVLWVNAANTREIPFWEITQGELVTIIGWESDPDAFSHEEEGTIQALPLKHTTVESEISWFVARTYVTQEFTNPFSKPIEAIYNFPLPHEASVDSMEMTIGTKKIIGKIDTRKEAERKYQEAKNNGQTAALLNQERPNIFTQKVANIMPWDNIKIRISYFEVLKYEWGKYNFVFPMVVGPRYNPASLTDAANITSPTIKAWYREWHTIDVKLHIVAGVNIKWLKSNSHDVNVVKIKDSEANITLKNAAEIPNKDFSFEYNVASDVPQIWILTHKVASEKDWYFALIAEPQKSPKQSEIRNKEIVFVLDTSGSMQWRPIETVKKAMIKAISNLGPNDSFNVYNFSDNLSSLYPESKNVTDEVKKQWLDYVNALRAWGGTMMEEPFIEALKNKWDTWDKIRIILWMTDWDIGNESEVLRVIKTWLGANRVFMFWVDAASNRYLLDKMAESGNGKSTYVLGEDNAEEKVDEFYNNFASPVLTDIKIDWDWLNTTDILPTKFADLYAGQPLYVYGKYSQAWSSALNKERNIKITAIRWNEPYTQIIKVNFKSEEKANSSIAAYWARQKIAEIYKDNNFTPNSRLEEEVTALGLKYSIMSEFTSFIAIDEEVRNTTGKTDTKQVPVYQVEWKDYRWIYWESTEMTDSVKMKNIPSYWINNSSSPQAYMEYAELADSNSSWRWGWGIMFWAEKKVNSSLIWAEASADTAMQSLVNKVLSILFIIWLIFWLSWLIKSAKAKWDAEKAKLAKKSLKIALIIIIITVVLYFWANRLIGSIFW